MNNQRFVAPGVKMPSAESEKARIILGLLESVDRDRGVSQRRLASDLGIALGLVNAYLKRCMKKGWVKVREVPTRRYAYLLTPHGLAEKSRLTAEYLSYSFSFFRAARADCAEALAGAKAAGCQRIILIGASDLAEIATICAIESGVSIVGVLDRNGQGKPFLHLSTFDSFAAAVPCDGALLTELKNPADLLMEATSHFGTARVFVPALLTGRMHKAAETESGSGISAAPMVGVS